ncbi:hypothetical protein [Lysinibacillus sp. NPDC096212]|uniref:hypothetical protein n=1 Tax=Lysinibacillus sp. NPDC096212 TaxID=3364135 RepID=UPI00380AC87D
MREQLFNLTLPKKYKENLFKYTPSLDGVPEWIDLQPLGYTKVMYQKFTLLIGIESMKYSLKEAIEDNSVSEEEIAEAQNLIEEQIEKYNEL